MTHAKNLAQKIQAFRDAAQELSEAWSDATYSRENKVGLLDDIMNERFPKDIRHSFEDFCIQVDTWANHSINELNKLP